MSNLRHNELPHYLYRCYDADDRLLYIGCTKDVGRRISLHRRDPRRKASRWLRVSMTRYEIEGPYANKLSALAAEHDAIFGEQPLFNAQEQREPGWMRTGSIARYLIAHGHIALATETACGCWGETLEAGDFDDWCVSHRHAAELARTG